MVACTSWAYCKDSGRRVRCTGLQARLVALRELLLSFVLCHCSCVFSATLHSCLLVSILALTSLSSLLTRWWLDSESTFPPGVTHRKTFCPVLQGLGGRSEARWGAGSF